MHIFRTHPHISHTRAQTQSWRERERIPVPVKCCQMPMLFQDISYRYCLNKYYRSSKINSTGGSTLSKRVQNCPFKSKPKHKLHVQVSLMTEVCSASEFAFAFRIARRSSPKKSICRPEGPTLLGWVINWREIIQNMRVMLHTNTHTHAHICMIKWHKIGERH